MAAMLLFGKEKRKSGWDSVRVQAIIRVDGEKTTSAGWQLASGGRAKTVEGSPDEARKVTAFSSLSGASSRMEVYDD